MSWTCPFCNRIATITANNVSEGFHLFNSRNKEGTELHLKINTVVCPNDKCREYTIRGELYKTEGTNTYSGPRQIRNPVGPPLMQWQLRPRSKAKPFPDFIPAPLIIDYEEACLIVADSPKASATLSRRCLQGVIRDFWGISKDRLLDEVRELKSKVDPVTWEAIDAVRSIGNIGAHMEKDINVIVDVDPGEAEVLIRLLETLFAEWYVARHTREEQMQEVIALAQAKLVNRKSEGVTNKDLEK